MDRYETNRYVKSHGVLLPNNQVFLTEPMKVFKKVKTYAHARPTIKNTHYTRLHEAEIESLKSLLHKSLKDITYTFAVANLIVPAGAIVNLAQNGSGKLRASKAFCWSIIRLNDKKEVACAAPKLGFDGFYLAAKHFSVNLDSINLQPGSYDGLSVVYKNFQVLPDEFCSSNEECSHGIHFFIEAKKAVNY
jgi:hypothetical protein